VRRILRQGRAGRYSYHWPFRGEKGYLWEGGIRVPAIIAWPGVLPAGKAVNQLAMSMDWLPTLLAAAGAKPDPAYQPDGVDLMPVLLGRAPEFERTVFWRTQDMAAARQGDWKYVRSGNNEYLANLSEDETENANLRLKHGTVFEQLKRTYEDWDKTMLPIPPEVRRGPWGERAEPRAEPGARAALEASLMFAAIRQASERRILGWSGRAQPAAQPCVRR
jgi:arylsulfatase A-like enzyme